MKKSAAIGAVLAFALAAFLVGRYSGVPSRKDGTASERILFCVDPMHPAYRSDKPGISPDCGMALLPAYQGDDPALKIQLLPGPVNFVDFEFSTNEVDIEIGNFSRRAPRFTRSPSLEGLRVNVPRKSRARTHAQVLGAQRGAHA
jgi:hypothetical protein